MHPSRVLPALRRARFWSEFLSALLFVSLLLPAHAAAPQWWAQRGVIAPDKARDDFAAINQGQLKNLAAKAVAEMNAKLTGGAGTVLNQRVASWAANTAQADDFAGVNIGQAKAVARPVYERLLAAGAITALPSWITTPAASNQDFAAANIGQVKNLFAFEVPDQVGTSGTDGTNPETGPGLPANSPFVISYHGWRSGSLTPDLDNTATVDTTGKVGFIRRYRWALTWGAETKPEKKLVSTHNEFLPTETDQESWKNDNTTSAESYRKIVTIMEPVYSDPENSSSILTQVKEHLRTYNISPYGESYTDQFIASHFSTAEKNMALQRDGQTTYEVTEGTWTEAECQPLTVGQAPPPHFFKQEAHGPTAPAASSWTAAAPTVVSSPETVLQSPGAEIPYDSLILPSTGELLATADSILEKKVAYYRNSEGNFTSSERHIGKKSTGRIKIAWRRDLSPPLTTEQKKAWLSHFKVVTKNNYQSSGQPPSTHSSTVPLAQYLGVNSTQAIEIAHLSPHMQPGYQAHLELSLVPTSFVPPGTDPTPNPAEPDTAPPPPGKLVLFTRQKEVKASAGSTSSAPSSFGIRKLDESQPLSATSVVYLKKTTLRTQFVSIVEDTPLPEDISRPVYDSGEAIGTETIVHTGDIKDTYFNDYSFSESQEWINPIRIVPQPPNSFSEPDVQTQVERKHDRSRTKMRDVTVSTQINTTSNILNTVRSTTITNVGYSLLDESSFAHDIKDVPGDSPPLVYTGEQSVNEFGSETKSWTKSWVDGEGNSRNESGGSTITYPTVSNQGTLTSLISEHSVFPDTDSVVDYDTPTRGGYSISLVDRGQVVGRAENSTELSVPLPWTSVDAAMRTQLAERPYPEWVRKGDVTSLSQIGQSVYECQFHPGEFSSKGSMLSWYLKHEVPTGTSAAQKAAMPPLTRLVYLLYKNPTGVKVHEEIKTLTVAPDQKSTVFEASALTDDLLPEGGKVTVSLLPVELVSRDKFLAGSFEIPAGWDNLAIEFIGPDGKHFDKRGNLLGNGTTKIYDRVTDILSETDKAEGGQPPDQKVWFVREGTGSRKISFYTCFNSVGQAQIKIYPDVLGSSSGTIVHDLVAAKDFADTIAYVDSWVKGTNFDWSVPPVVLPPSVLALASQIAADPSANGISPISIANMLALGAIITADTNIPLVPDIANLTLGQPLADTSALGSLAALQVAPLDTVQPQTPLTLTPGTVYWLSNSVLHPLSEEQLNAITTQAGSLTMTAWPSLATQPPAGGFVAGTADSNLNGPIDNLTRAALIPFFNVINQVEGLGNVAVGLFDGVKGGLQDDWVFIHLIGTASVEARDWAHQQALAEILRWKNDPLKRASELKILAEKICEDMVFKPIELGQELSTWNGFRRRSWQIWQVHKGGAQTIWTVTTSAWPNIVNGLTDWADDFNGRMMAGSEKAHWDGAPWMKNHLLSEINSTTRQMCYTFGYTFGYLCEQVAIGALSSGTVTMAQVAAKGGTHLAGNLAKRTAAAVAARAHMLKRMLAEAAKLPDDIIALFQQRLSMAGVGPTGEGMLKVPLEVLQEGAESARFNFKQYFESVFDSPNLNKFLRQGDMAAQKAANSLLLDRMAQMKTILGDGFTETLQKNFMKVVEDFILVKRPDGTVDEFFEGFLRAMEGNPSLLKNADDLSVKIGGTLEELSPNAKARLKQILSDPDPGNPWKLDTPEEWNPDDIPIPSNYYARGLLLELQQFKMIYKPKGFKHLPIAAGYDYSGSIGGFDLLVQMKTLRNPDGAFSAMKKAIDKLAAAIPDGAPANVKAQLHIVKRPGSASAQLKAQIDAYIAADPTKRTRFLETLIEEFEIP